MVSDKQNMEIEKKILIVAKTFLETPVSNEEIAEITKISSSSVQRYLNDSRIITLLGQEAYDEIQKKIKENRLNSRKKGGIISTTNNMPLRDSDGKFNGNKKR